VQSLDLGGEPAADSLHGCLAWFDEQLAVGVAADIETQEIEAFLESTKRVLASLKVNPLGCSHSASCSLTASACSRLVQMATRSSA